MESRISRVRPQRVYDLAINLTPPMSLLLMLQLLHYLAAFLYLCFCQGRWGKCPAALTGLEINDFIEEKLRKMYLGWGWGRWGINPPECTMEASIRCRARWQVWHTAEELYHSKKWLTDQNYEEKTAGFWGFFFSEVIKGSKLRVENTPSRSSVIYLITSERSPLVKQSREAYPAHQTW